jgi:hypothetical protein
VQRRQVREYDEYLRRKVEAARADKEEGRSLSNDDVEAEFAAIRSDLLNQAKA